MRVLDYRHTLAKQQGAALLVSMVLLIVLTILVLGSMRNAGLNARMTGNTQIFNSFKNSIDGEGFAQASFFSAKAMASGADKLINNAIIATENFNKNPNAPLLVLNNLSKTSYKSSDMVVKLIDMSSEIRHSVGTAPTPTDEPAIKEKDFIHGSMCQGYGQAVGCKNMVIYIDAKPASASQEAAGKLGMRSEQMLGFGIIAPKDEGNQAIQPTI